MSRFAGRVAAYLVLAGALAPAHAADRTAKEILADVAAITRPASYEEFLKSGERKADLAAELKQVDPGNAQLPKLLTERWIFLSVSGKGDAAMAEVDEALAHAKDDAARVEPSYAKAILTMRSQPEQALPAIEAFAKLAPKGDRRAPGLMYQASQSLKGEALTQVEDRITRDFPDSPYAGMIAGARKQREAVGKPLDLEFADAIKGTPVTMKGLKGKVVVLDFWATWCGPCVAEMPTMKKLYSEYKDKGVEFIGVSLDSSKEEGGLDALKAFVKEKEITWPQYYQGNGWASEFSKGWGINSIPCVFIVDADGNLASVEARGKLESLIPELLAKAKPATAGGL